MICIFWPPQKISWTRQMTQMITTIVLMCSCTVQEEIVSLFAGDSHDETWRHILAEHREDVTNIDLLIAPHHGRDSKRSYEFLDTLNPKLTFFGNAPSEHLAYGAWNRRYLSKITNNQAGCMVVDAQESPMHLWVTNKSFAERVNRATCYNKEVKAWYVGPITEDLIS